MVVEVVRVRGDQDAHESFSIRAGEERMDFGDFEEGRSDGIWQVS